MTQGTQSLCSVATQRDRVGREDGGGFIWAPVNCKHKSDSSNLPFRVLHWVYNQLVKITEKGKGADTLFRLWNTVFFCKLMVEAVYFENKLLVKVISV